MAFFIGKPHDEIDIDEQPTEPIPAQNPTPSLCPICLMAMENGMEEGKLMAPDNHIALVPCDVHLKRLRNAPDEDLPWFGRIIQTSCTWYSWPSDERG